MEYTYLWQRIAHESMIIGMDISWTDESDGEPEIFPNGYIIPSTSSFS